MYYKSLKNVFVKKQIKKPMAAGSKIERKVHFKLWVSFFIVKIVVAHGQCISVKITVFNAVTVVQPFCAKIVFS